MALLTLAYLAALLLIPDETRAQTTSGVCVCGSPPPAFFLAGDSTTAVQSSDGGGWGNGFLSFLKAPAVGINFGHNGATTKSFVEMGDWATVIAEVKNHTDFRSFVTIQVRNPYRTSLEMGRATH